MADSSDFRPDIEGLRAVAIGLVLLYHAQIDLFSGGFIGVDVFFVLSGYLITRSLIREAESSGNVRLGAFYARRVRRLLPASALVLVATGVGVWTALPSTMWRAFGGDVAAAAAYVVNWRFAGRAVDYLAQDVLPSPVQHFWSLSIEEQFYALWPLLIVVAIWVATRLRRSTRAIAGMLLTAVIFLPSLAWSVRLTGSDPAAAFFVTTTRLWELAVGAIVAVAAPRLVIPSSAGRLALKAAALAAIGVAAIAIDEGTPWPGAMALVPTMGTAVLIVAGGSGSDVVERALSLKPMQLVGAWSYSLYLWHWPPLAIMAARLGGLDTRQAVAITAASVVPAVVAYYLVESPLRYRRSLRDSVPLALSTGLSLSLVGVVAGLAVVAATPAPAPVNAGSEDPAGARWVQPGVTREGVLASLEQVEGFVPAPEAALDDRPGTYLVDCHQNQSDGEPIVCERGDPEGGVVVAIVGDSKMAQWEPAFHLIGQRAGWRVLNVTKSACELSLAMPNLDDDPYESCLEWSEGVVEVLPTLGVDVAVVSQISRNAWRSDDEPRDEALLLEGMTRAYGALRDAGIEVIVLMDNPSPPLVVRDCVAERPDDLSACAFERAAVEDSGGRLPLRTVGEAEDLAVVDMADVVCPAGVCAPVVGGVLVYRDGSHITATYVRTMADALEVRLLPVTGDLR